MQMRSTALGVRSSLRRCHAHITCSAQVLLEALGCLGLVALKQVPVGVGHISRGVADVGTKGLVTSKMGPTFLLRANAPRCKAGAGAQRIETQDFSLFRAEQHGFLEGMSLC